MEFRSIEIDFDIHKLIEAERRGFAESPNDALRRLLKLAPPATKPADGKAPRSWSGYGIELPHGTELRMTYNGMSYRGVIQDGQWDVEGEFHTSPSGAASAVARTKAGGKTRLDGWRYWEAKKPGEMKWIGIWSLWQAAGKAKKAG